MDEHRYWILCTAAGYPIAPAKLRWESLAWMMQHYADRIWHPNGGADGWRPMILGQVVTREEIRTEITEVTFD